MAVRISAEEIDRLLPQTQCTRCGYDGCRPYAEALAAGAAAINRCPPGGETGIARLAERLGRTPLPLDPSCGTEQPLKVAIVDEPRCIGCAICLDACPVDAIVGAQKQMHTVVQDWCTGCERCVAPCPVDCIALRDAPDPDWTTARAEQARRRFEARNVRKHRESEARTEQLQRATLERRGEISELRVNEPRVSEPRVSEPWVGEPR